MKAPDKIYVPMVNLGIEDGEHPAPLWWNKDKKSEHPDVAGTIEYIRKDALLEWAENWGKYKLRTDDGFLYAMELLINKLNSL